MIKTASLFIIILIAVTSCKKRYSCVCYYQSNNAGPIVTDLGKLKKQKAQSACDYSGSYIIAAGGICEAKVK